VSYTIDYREHGMTISGPVPLGDMSGLIAIATEHGYDIVDGLLSERVVGATMVFTDKEGSQAWRKELGLDEEEPDDD